MKKRILRHPFLSSPHSPESREAKTGEHCPVTGWWAPSGEEADAHFVTEGSIMPSRQGGSTSWALAAGRMEAAQLQSASAAGGAQ
ncbi:hypothetical protein [Pseudarthrobacter sp. NamB4]|uniref:hypothetical protein n=1 Tax=Pseudarthrobacter sp. NamB4 TaxID=2576837 RepID=UPI00197AB569|nr:hypothetical protein [Pseudarthrobacter sp. NamB4]